MITSALSQRFKADVNLQVSVSLISNERRRVGLFCLFVCLITSKNGRTETNASAHLLIGCSPETWPWIRCSSGCRRRDSSWKTKFSSSGSGTCQHTPRSATSPALPQSCRNTHREREREREDFSESYRKTDFPLEQLASKPASKPQNRVICRYLKLNVRTLNKRQEKTNSATNCR